MARRTTTRNEREQKRSKAWSKREDDEIFERTRPAKQKDQRRLSGRRHTPLARTARVGAHNAKREAWRRRILRRAFLRRRVGSTRRREGRTSPRREERERAQSPPGGRRALALAAATKGDMNTFEAQDKVGRSSWRVSHQDLAPSQLRVTVSSLRASSGYCSSRRRAST